MDGSQLSDGNGLGAAVQGGGANFDDDADLFIFVLDHLAQQKLAHFAYAWLAKYPNA